MYFRMSLLEVSRCVRSKILWFKIFNYCFLTFEALFKIVRHFFETFVKFCNPTCKSNIRSSCWSYQFLLKENSFSHFEIQLWRQLICALLQDFSTNSIKQIHLSKSYLNYLLRSMLVNPVGIVCTWLKVGFFDALTCFFARLVFR